MGSYEIRFVAIKINNFSRNDPKTRHYEKRNTIRKLKKYKETHKIKNIYHDLQISAFVNNFKSFVSQIVVDGVKSFTFSTV